MQTETHEIPFVQMRKNLEMNLVTSSYTESDLAGSSSVCLRSNILSCPLELTVRTSNCFRNVILLIVQLSALSAKHNITIKTWVFGWWDGAG